MVPDVVVRKLRGQWLASLNAEAMPRLRINRLYADILQGQRGSGLASQLQEAKWLIKNVQQRFETIQRVSQAIVDRQRHFFEHGEVAMRPLVLREIADTLGLHESTVSRISVGMFWSEISLRRYQDASAAQKAATQAESSRLKAEIARRVSLEQDLRVLASTDALTGLVNRRAFMERFSHELARSQRHGPSPTLIILDIDHFKKINDRYGHPAGDAVLAHLAQLLRASLRNVDIVGRIGGEEFAVVLVETNVEMATPVITRLLERIREGSVTLADGMPLKFTASIGSTEILWGDTIDTAIQRADEALYTAKKNGRDRHCQR